MLTSLREQCEAHREQLLTQNHIIESLSNKVSILTKIVTETTGSPDLNNAPADDTSSEPPMDVNMEGADEPRRPHPPNSQAASRKTSLGRASAPSSKSDHIEVENSDSSVPSEASDTGSVEMDDTWADKFEDNSNTSTTTPPTTIITNNKRHADASPPRLVSLTRNESGIVTVFKKRTPPETGEVPLI